MTPTAILPVQAWRKVCSAAAQTSAQFKLLEPGDRVLAALSGGADSFVMLEVLLVPSTPPSIRVFSNESTLHMRWPKFCSFNFSIIPSKEHPGLISFRMDWLDLLAVQGTLKSLLQHHSSKASIVQCSVFFMVQLSHPYMTTGKTIAITIWTFISKVISLLFNTLSGFVVT